VIHVPFRLLKAFHKVQMRLVRELEKKFSGKDVVIVANRRILPKPTTGSSIARPRSRTLTAVHAALLEDLVFPTEIVGKRTRYRTDGSKLLKVFLDPKDRCVGGRPSAHAAVRSHALTLRFLPTGTRRSTSWIPSRACMPRRVASGPVLCLTVSRITESTFANTADGHPVQLRVPCAAGIETRIGIPSREIPKRTHTPPAVLHLCVLSRVNRQSHRSYEWLKRRSLS